MLEIFKKQEIEEYEHRIHEIMNLDLPERHSFFQLQHFLLNKEPTIQAKLWQCIREIKSRKKSLDALVMEMEEQRDNLQLVLLDIEEHSVNIPVTILEKDRHCIQRRKLERKKRQVETLLVDLEKKEKNIQEEIIFFAVAFSNLTKVQQLKNFDSEEVQKEYWEKKMRTELNARVLTNHPLDPELLKTIMALHDDSEIKQSTKKVLANKLET